MDSDDGTVRLSSEEARTQAESEVLLRTARASQLRRRPAIRSSLHNNDLYPLRDSSADATPEELGINTMSPSRLYELRCGSGVLPEPDAASRTPYPLPLLPNSLKRKYADTFAPSTPSSNTQPSNGCGRLIDRAARPEQYLSVWLSNSPSRVAPLDNKYAATLSQDETTRALGQQICGCVRRLVGCASCGNVLGHMLSLCVNHSSPSRDYPAPDTRYLLFHTRVTSSPEYTFPSSSSGPIGIRPGPTDVHRWVSLRRQRARREIDQDVYTMRYGGGAGEMNDASAATDDRPPTPPAWSSNTVRRRIVNAFDEESDPDEGSLSRWLSMHGESSRPYTSRASRPRSPSVDSNTPEETEFGAGLGGRGGEESLFPFPSTMGHSTANAFTFSRPEPPDGDSVRAGGTGSRSSGSGTAVSRPAASSSSLYDELVSLRRQHAQNFASLLTSSSNPTTSSSLPPPTVGRRRRQASEVDPLYMISSTGGPARTIRTPGAPTLSTRPLPHENLLPLPQRLNSTGLSASSSGEARAEAEPAIVEGPVAPPTSSPMARRHSRLPSSDAALPAVSQSFEWTIEEHEEEPVPESHAHGDAQPSGLVVPFNDATPTSSNPTPPPEILLDAIFDCDGAELA